MMPGAGAVAAIIGAAVVIYGALAAAVCHLVPENKPTDTAPIPGESRLFITAGFGLGDTGLLRVAPVLAEIAGRKPVSQPLPREMGHDEPRNFCPPEFRYPARYATTTTPTKDI